MISSVATPIFSSSNIFYPEMETEGTSETLVPLYQTSRLHTLEDGNPHIVMKYFISESFSFLNKEYKHMYLYMFSIIRILLHNCYKLLYLNSFSYRCRRQSVIIRLQCTYSNKTVNYFYCLHYVPYVQLTIQVQSSKQQLLLICFTLHDLTMKGLSSGVSSYTLLHYWIVTSDLHISTYIHRP
jgi:hypothetical protein